MATCVQCKEYPEGATFTFCPRKGTLVEPDDQACISADIEGLLVIYEEQEL